MVETIGPELPGKFKQLGPSHVMRPWAICWTLLVGARKPVEGGFFESPE